MSMKNSSGTIGNRTRDLPACSAVPRPTAPPRTPPSGYRVLIKLLYTTHNKVRHQSRSSQSWSCYIRSVHVIFLAEWLMVALCLFGSYLHCFNEAVTEAAKDTTRIYSMFRTPNSTTKPNKPHNKWHWQSVSFYHRSTAPVGHGLLTVVSVSHSDTPQSEWLLCTNDRPVAEPSTWQHTSQETNIHSIGGIGIHNPNNRVAAVPYVRKKPYTNIITFTYSTPMVSIANKQGLLRNCNSLPHHKLHEQLSAYTAILTN
jgi:hypothetical protein